MKNPEELALATLGLVHWHNNEILHGCLGDLLPAEFEETLYAEQRHANVLGEK